MTQDGTPPPTLGERLEAEGRLLAARLQVQLPWAGPLHLLMDRTAALAAGADRFDRIDVAPDRPLPPAPAPAAPSSMRRPDPGSGASPAPEPGRAGGSHRPPGPPRPPAPPPGAQPREETGDPLPAPTRSRLRAAVGPAAGALRAHHDTPADALARGRRADAVTVGRDVYFRHGRLNPQDPRGFGLLVHEATHVLALLRPGASWFRATGAGTRAEESEALRNEQAARAGAAPPPPAAPAPPDPALQAGGPSGPSWPTFAPPAGAQPGAPPAVPPAGAPPTVPPAGMRSPIPPPGPGASPLSPAPAPAQFPTPGDAAAAAIPDAHPAARPLAAPAERETTPEAGPPPLDVAALRRDLINDLMRQLRSESERGG
ncbi:eCIS core domain-containing protein [Streptomyces swartbergensis]|uniref:eCIS core domain-containing protein n=1 Tax=Streptomyces swartbergensis TaxID=487165 RepID=UPI00380B8FF6